MDRILRTASKPGQQVALARKIALILHRMLRTEA
jgi:hypothetical protein